MLATDASWLLFLDSDVEFPADTLDRLLEVADPEDRPIVTGVYMRIGRDGEASPCLFRSALFEGGVQMVPYVPLPDDEIIEVDGCGAGMLLIHRSLLEEMLVKYGYPTPWFAEMSMTPRTTRRISRSVCGRGSSATAFTLTPESTSVT